MAGNVWEWVADWYDENYYANSDLTNPTGPAPGTGKVMRGGGYSSGEWDARTTARDKNAPTDPFGNVGFRCAQTP